MAKKALAAVPATETKPATTSRRQEIRAQRQARRTQIIARWHRRVAIRMFEDDTLADTSVTNFIYSLLHYGKWVPHGVLLEVSTLDTAPLSEYLLRIIELKEMPYDEYLQTREWKKLAARAKRRYGGKCALDETHEAVDAHHRTYVRRGRELDNDLIPLCRECHSKFHGRS